MAYDFDVIEIGSGAGGGTVAYACARAGKGVPLVGGGPRPAAAGPPHDERETLFAKRPYDDRPVRVNGTPKRLYMGGVLGGGTSLYGAALVRPSRDDFHPGRHYGDRLPRQIWDWPLAYDELAPYYAEAERLYGVTGCAEDDFGPLEKPARGFPAAAIPTKPVNRRLVAANATRGLKPFRLPLAIDFDRCLQCPVCPGYVCPNGARRSSAHLVESATAGGNLTVRTGAEVESLTADGGGSFDGVRVRDRATGDETVYRARRYVLAAGAIASPALLLRSGHAGPQVGRNYMVHVSPIVAGVFAHRTGADQ